MVRGLVLLLLLLASYVTPPLEGVATGTEEIRASQLASESIATVDRGGPHLSGAVERLPRGPGEPTTPPATRGAVAQLAVIELVDIVMQERAPRTVPVASEMARRDQRPTIRRLKHRAPSLDTASSKA